MSFLNWPVLKLFYSLFIKNNSHIFFIQAYRSCAKRASILFFVLNDLSRIDPMYQFSLESYIQLFILSIEKSPKSSIRDDRIGNLNDYHTHAFFK